MSGAAAWAHRAAGRPGGRANRRQSTKSVRASPRVSAFQPDAPPVPCQIWPRSRTASRLPSIPRPPAPPRPVRRRRRRRGEGSVRTGQLQRLEAPHGRPHCTSVTRSLWLSPSTQALAYRAAASPGCTEERSGRQWQDSALRPAASSVAVPRVFLSPPVVTCSSASQEKQSRRRVRPTRACPAVLLVLLLLVPLRLVSSLRHPSPPSHARERFRHPPVATAANRPRSWQIPSVHARARPCSGII